jgi:ferredoxin
MSKSYTIQIRWADDGTQKTAQGSLSATSTDLLEDLLKAKIRAPHGCRAGSCGACAVKVLSGGDSLEPVSFIEENTLARVGLGPGGRLTCQTRFRANLTEDVTLVLEVPSDS